MKKKFGFLLFALILLTGGILFYLFILKGNKENTTHTSFNSSFAPIGNTVNAAAVEAREKSYGKQIKTFIVSKKFNPRYCILIDMSQPSNQNRLFLYDIQKDSILKTGLVAHGTGSEKRDKDKNLVFSNVDGSLCTSLGRYKVGLPYKGIWGYAYRLHGLDSTNSNAFKRAIVMHAHSCIPDGPQNNNYPICFSYGCPMLSHSTLAFLRKYLDKPDKPVLMWIYK